MLWREMNAGMLWLVQTITLNTQQLIQFLCIECWEDEIKIIDTTEPAAKMLLIPPWAIMTSPQFVSDESIYSEEQEIWRHGDNG